MKQAEPTRFDDATTARMLAAVKAEGRPPAQRNGVGAVVQPERGVR